MEIAGCFKKRIGSYLILTESDHIADIPSFLDSCKDRVVNLQGEKMIMFSNIKFNCELFAHYTCATADSERNLKSFNTRYVAVNPSSNITATYDGISATINWKSEEFQVIIHFLSKLFVHFKYHSCYYNVKFTHVYNIKI